MKQPYQGWRRRLLWALLVTVLAFPQAALTQGTRITTTAVVCSPNTIFAGESSTCTATVSDVDPSGTKSTPAGTVDFSSSETSDSFTPLSCTLVAVDSVSSSCAVTATTDITVNVPSHTIAGTYVPNGSPHATSADNDLLTVNPNFTLQITAGGTVSATVGAADVEAGFVEMLDQTTLEITANGNWKVTASVTNVNFPVLVANNPNTVEVKNNDDGIYSQGGGVVQTGVSTTGGSPVTITVDARLNLMSVGNAPHGNYDFDVVYTISAN